MDELYEVLGVSKNATPKEIKKAYKDKSKIHHPDKESGNEDLFKKIQKAYTVLIDPLSRKMYDITGNAEEVSFEKEIQTFFDTYIIPEIINIEKTSFERVDIIKLIHALINDKIRELENKINQSKEVKRRLELILFRKRNKFTESEDILHKLFEPHIKKAEMNILMLRAEFDFIYKVCEIMEGYDYNIAAYMADNIIDNV
jgi:DnaJ-class molecular chaperone